MKLDGFRELLIKKAGDVSVANLVRFMRDDVLSDLVIESLEKMARSNSKGDSSNLAVRDFASEMDPEHEPNMLHDALSHHASHYKAALNSGNKPIANAHAKQLFRIMDMADQAQKHSDGKLKVDAVSPHAWERNAKGETFSDKMEGIKQRISGGEPVSDKEKEWLSDNPVTRGQKKPGQFINDTKAWRFRGNDYSFLQQAPHESYSSEIRRHGHNNAYPLEAITVNGKHLDVEDLPPSQHYAQHPFDSHPVMDHFEEPIKNRTPERDAQYMKARDEHASSPAMDKYFSNMESRQEKDPQAHATRGQQMSAPVHAPVTPLDTESARSMSQESAPAPTSAQTPATAVAPQAAPAAAPQSDAQREARRKVIAGLPPELRAKMSKLYGE